MTTRLVIVESPTKARTLKRFLGRGFLVESSVGHVRDLPASAAEIPEKYKKEKWSRLGVNVKADFAPLYIVQPDKKKVIRSLKAKLKGVDELLLATDEDREGEAISWHLIEVLNPKVPMKRMVFHEITREAVIGALEHTRPLDTNMVEAYRARRILDRLYGYEVSPVLWRKVAPRLSAGRVQSVAIRILVEREKARMRFKPARFWDLTATFRTVGGEDFPARMVSLGGQRLAGSKDFDPDTGTLHRRNGIHLEEDDARELATRLESAAFEVLSTQKKPFTQTPAAPFTTSTMQQEGGRKLGFDARRTMRAAQRLYELGYITYMRTDSVALSPQALRSTRRAVEDLYGREYLPDAPRTYRNKVKNAQEAHEAIRPAGEAFPKPAEIRSKVSADEVKLYELIWKRTMASQMKAARGWRMTVQVQAEDAGREVVFQARGKTIDFPGFLRAYVEGSDDPRATLADQEVLLPPVKEGDGVTPERLEAEEHVTQPPPRLTEASLVKTLEESGIGRPSTFSTIIQTILKRDYTFKKGPSLVPTFTAFAVVKLMTEHLEHLVDMDFTAHMEDRLDSISRGEQDALPYLKEFYFGNGTTGLQPLLENLTEKIDAQSVCSIPLPFPVDDQEVVVRVGRYGPFLKAGDVRAPLPDNTCPDELTLDRVREILEDQKAGPQSMGVHPQSGLPVYLKKGRYGPYVQLGDAEPGSKEKPKMVSLLPSMNPETLTFMEAMDLLSLPRTLGADDSGVEVLAHLGRYGPYIKRGTDTRSLEDGDNVLTVDLDRALVLLAQEKRRGRSAASTLKVFEKVEALDGVDLQLKKGRYGPYVTDGEVNATLPRDIEDPLSLAEDRAVQLILDKRARGTTRKKKKKAAKKKAGTQKTTKKKTTKKKTGKKAAKKKAVKKIRVKRMSG